MKKLWIAGLSVAAFSLFAGTFSIHGTTDKKPVEYNVGERMVFTVSLLEDGKPISGPTLKWTRQGDDGKKESGSAVADGKNPLVIKTSIDKPGFVRVTVKAYDKNGKEIGNPNKKKCLFDGSAGADVFSLKGYPEPKEFDSFWEKQKARLAKTPMKVTLKEHPSKRKGVKVYEFSITAPGDKPATGWLCYPENAKPKSLKAVVNTIGYGIDPISPNYGAGQHSLAMTISRHGIPMAQSPEFYKNLKKEIAGFCFKNNNDAEKTYYNGLLLRDLRALEYLKTRPEWNGKDLKTTGGSMGAYQSIALAALDRDVTECSGFIPWCADLGGVKLGRMGGWRPGYTDVLGLYDIANFAKRLKCPTEITIILGDYVCPPSGQFVMYNNMKCAKKLSYSLNGGHGSQFQKQPSYQISAPPAK